MTDVLEYVIDVLQNINDGNGECCMTMSYKGQHNERLDSVLKKLLKRHLHLEKEVVRYQSLLSENDSVNSRSNHDDRVCLECLNQCTNVALAVSNGDFKKRVTCPLASGPMLILRNAINTMVDKVDRVSIELIHVVHHEVGEKGKLGVQSKSENLEGDWKDMMVHLNMMSSNHSEQIRDIAKVCTAVTYGDFSKKITVDVKGEALILKNIIEIMVERLNSFASEVTRVVHEVGNEGKLGVQAQVQGVDGKWKLLTDNVNTMSANLADQFRDIADVTKSITRGDLCKKITVDAKGEIFELKNIINTIVDQLQTFTTEFTRISTSRLGNQTNVKNVDGIWKVLTDHANQVREIATVCKALAYGDLSKKITMPVQGEILELKITINTMIEQLRMVAAEITRVTNEISQGILDSQCLVQGVDGVWKLLTDNLNTMTESLSLQVHGMTNASEAAIRGDLSKKVNTLDVKGEILDLKNNINTMIDKLHTLSMEAVHVSLDVETDKSGDQVEDVATQVRSTKPVAKDYLFNDTRDKTKFLTTFMF